VKVLFALLVVVLTLGAQQPVVQPNAASRFRAAFYLRMEPDSAAADLSGWSANQRREGDKVVVHLGAYSKGRRVYWGCEVVLEARGEDGVYLARFRPLTVTAPDFVNGFAAANRGDPSGWTIEPPPGWPPPQRIAVGETLTLDLMTNFLTGERLTGNLLLQPVTSASAFSSDMAKLSDSELRDLESRLREARRDTGKQIGEQILLAMRPNPAVPVSPQAADGTPHEFSLSDAGLQISNARVRINGADQRLVGGNSFTGPVTWIYLPGRGRFLLSLLPRSGFSQAGAVEGRLLEIEDGQDSVLIDSRTPIVSDFGNYIIYVRHEKEWRPAGPDVPQLGAISGKEGSSLFQVG
jgi:hypothetical protein